MSRTRAVAGVIAVALIVAACSAPSPTAESTTTAAPTTAVPTTTVPSPSTIPTSTTTDPPAVVTVTIEGRRDLGAVVESLYAWIGDRTRPAPPAPDALLTHLATIRMSGTLALSADAAVARIAGGRVAVVTIDDDVVLAADAGDGWEIVGAKLARFGSSAWYGPPIRHVLVLGSDARHANQPQPLYRADSIHIVSSNLERRAGEVTGFPRDTYVRASYGWDKFTHVNAVSPRHADEMLDIARDLSGLPIEGYLITGFRGFRRLVDLFGGVVVEVPFRMVDEKAEADLRAGLQRLLGDDALAFSRIRSIPGGDFARSANQGVVILAALAATRERDITAIPDLLVILTDHTWTDLTPGQLLTLAATAFEVDPRLVGNRVLAGTVVTRNGASVVLLDEPRAAITFRDLVDGVVDG